MRVDIDKLNQIYADDFATIASSGRLITKKDLLSDFESSHHKLESFGNGPMDVQVFGNVAVVHAGVAEKRIQDTIAALAPTQFVYDKRPPVDPDDDQLPVRPPLSVCSRPMLQ